MTKYKCLPVNIPLYLFIILIPFIFCNCSTTRAVDHWVDTHYAPMINPKVKAKDKEYITITPDITQREIPYSNTVKGNSKFIPALFYWKWQRNFNCTLNKSIPVSNFSTTVFTYAASKNLRDKLNGARLELTIDQFPNVFTFKDYGWAVFVLVWYISHQSVSVDPENKDLVVSYNIIKDGATLKHGIVTIADRNIPIGLKFMQGTEKMAWKYLDQYDNNIKIMAKQFIDQLLTQIE